MLINYLLSLANAFASFYLFILFYFINQRVVIFDLAGIIKPILLTENWIFGLNIFIYILFGLLISKILLCFGTTDTLSTSEISPLEPSYIPTYIGFFVIALSLGPELSSTQLFWISLILFYAWWKLGKTAYFNMFLLALGYSFYQTNERSTGTEMIVISKEKDRKNQLEAMPVRRINNFTFLTL